MNKPSKPYIEVLKGQLKGAEDSMIESRELFTKAEMHHVECMAYYLECKERYENMLNENQNTNGNSN